MKGRAFLFCAYYCRQTKNVGIYTAVELNNEKELEEVIGQYDRWLLFVLFQIRNSPILFMRSAYILRPRTSINNS